MSKTQEECPGAKRIWVYLVEAARGMYPIRAADHRPWPADPSPTSNYKFLLSVRLFVSSPPVSETPPFCDAKIYVLPLPSLSGSMDGYGLPSLRVAVLSTACSLRRTYGFQDIYQMPLNYWDSEHMNVM